MKPAPGSRALLVNQSSSQMDKALQYKMQWCGWFYQGKSKSYKKKIENIYLNSKKNVFSTLYFIYYKCNFDVIVFIQYLYF